MKRTTRLRALIADKEILVIPVVHDPLCAKIAEYTGFSAYSLPATQTRPHTWESRT